ncbi:hypothetical protein EES43_09530 [Streptomyces sp. ADI96-02]|uniref:hypothetical protein n=1 Tax=unclassified Streptomyces TaxID=2593676 RepID=UPI000F559628|nr:hypothetical protein [Streptomyces sp. ADI96-02]RPK64596.1 hypothetical protein EES43_09530 [Streptomyces sp. ADI96-02]
MILGDTRSPGPSRKSARLTRAGVRLVRSAFAVVTSVLAFLLLLSVSTPGSPYDAIVMLMLLMAASSAVLLWSSWVLWDERSPDGGPRPRREAVTAGLPSCRRHGPATTPGGGGACRLCA